MNNTAEDQKPSAAKQAMSTVIVAEGKFREKQLHSAIRVMAVFGDERKDLDERIKQAREGHTRLQNELIAFDEDYDRDRALKVAQIDKDAELIAELTDVHGAVSDACVALDRLTKKAAPAPEKVAGRRVRKPRVKK